MASWETWHPAAGRAGADPGWDRPCATATRWPATGATRRIPGLAA